ncbi:MAG: tripartite tricarboxylate transporter permease [Nanoarchaeota archaeon]|nr:tripartite tricarboxylate transporter permease [Nanoarchaeota archaeon]
MLIELIIAIILGIIAGTITGLIPGIHINLISIIILSLSLSLLTIVSPIILVIFIVSMAITHTFLDFIPSIYLGAPDPDSALSILPGHEFLLKGKAHSAILYTLTGSLTALPIILIFTPIFIIFLPQIYPHIKNVIPIILIIASLFLISQEKTSKFYAISIFLLSGFLGITTLNLHLNQPLLPLLTGLFGGSSLISSILRKQKVPEQKIEKISITKRQITRTAFSAALSAPLFSFLPALGANQSAIISSSIIKKPTQKEFLILLGIINTVVMALSFITLQTISYSRTGAAISVKQIIENLTTTHLIYILITIIITSFIAFFIGIHISKFFSKNITKFNYTKLSITILIFLIIITTIFSGFIGLLIFITSTFLGLATILIGIKRTYLMGCLIIPTILLYIL